MSPSAVPRFVISMPTDEQSGVQCSAQLSRFVLFRFVSCHFIARACLSYEPDPHRSLIEVGWGLDSILSLFPEDRMHTDPESSSSS